MERDVHGHRVRGVDVGPETRCAHYDSERDVVAVRFRCCGEHFPCFRCHDAVADHDRERWSRDDRSVEAVLCGVCGTELAISTYLDCGSTCPSCGTAFNPGCADHYDLYFEGPH
ncbi:CHY zinc finger protein [Halomicrococcus sp. NG-SE-24]|uniref:CHY zinc finger protein n=1 Tax=Halomicrococcus sp. NG-SE-24 TaxID=3436928 RepID=UPI003D9960BF